MLSCGHSSLTLYIQLYLSGYGLALDDLASLRQWDSLTPGHPEYGHTPGVEVTTGPLGQGIGNAVGMAMAARRERGLFDPAADAGESPFDHNVYALCSDGDIEEGVSHESSAIAAVQKLGNLTLIYDDNEISIEDDTRIAKSEDVGARYAAYGWHVQTRRLAQGRPGQGRLPRGRRGALDGDPGRPRRSPTSRRSSCSRRSSAGPRRTSRTPARSTARRWAPTRSRRPRRSSASTRTRRSPSTRPCSSTPARSPSGAAPRTPSGSKALRRLGRRPTPRARRCSTGWPRARCPTAGTKALPEFPADAKGIATRAASQQVLNALAPVLPELWGGSADLAESNNTTMKGEPSFIPAEYATKAFPGNEYGRTLHFGIREHGMGSILNGITAARRAPARTAARSWSSATTCAAPSGSPR